MQTDFHQKKKVYITLCRKLFQLNQVHAINDLTIYLISIFLLVEITSCINIFITIYKKSPKAYGKQFAPEVTSTTSFVVLVNITTSSMTVREAYTEVLN